MIEDSPCTAPRPGPGLFALLLAVVAALPGRGLAQLPPVPAQAAEPGTPLSGTPLPGTTFPGTREASVFEDLFVAPVRVWGDVGYELRRERIEGFPSLTRQFVSLGVNATSYLYAPWAALITAGVRLTTAVQSQGGFDGDDQFVTGYARLNLFPSSRFPFQARFDRSDSRLDSGIGPEFGYTSTHWGATQRYRSLDNGSQISVSYDQFEQDSRQFGRDVQQLGRFDASTTLRQRHQLAMTGTLGHNERVGTGQETIYDTLAARHLYAPDSSFSLENSANVTRTAADLFGFRNELRFLQANSVAFWRPTARPLTVTGSLRLFTLADENDDATSRSESLNGSLGASYLLSRNLSVNGSLSATRARFAGEERRIATTQAGASWQSDSLALGGGIDYNWFAASSLIATTGADEFDGLTATTQLGHTVVRNVPLGGSTLAFSASQAYSLFQGALTDSTKQIAHAASVTWSTIGERSNAFVRVNFADSRFLDGRQEVFQLANLQGTVTGESGRNASWSGNVTLQSTRSFSDDPLFRPNNGEWVPTSSADLTYARRRLFGVPRVTFQSQLRVLRNEVIQFLGPPEDREAKSWENRLDFLVGRLESRIAIRVSEVDGRTRWLLSWRIVRRFGN